MDGIARIQTRGVANQYQGLTLIINRLIKLRYQFSLTNTLGANLLAMY